MEYNIHDNSYCAYVKSTSSGQKICNAQQKKVFERCLNEQEAFCGICHAGVFEYVYPIFDGERILGFISVSGYMSALGEQHISNTAERLDVSCDILIKAYGTLKSEIPTKQRVDTLIIPLCKMIELAYRKTEKDIRETDKLIDRILRYVRQNYKSSITAELICREFSCSRSYLSHTFKNAVGNSFSEYLIHLRINHAKHLLEFSSLNITEIAFSVGFNDSNYFSSVFKKHVGITPLAYRKQYKR